MTEIQRDEGVQCLVQLRRREDGSPGYLAVEAEFAGGALGAEAGWRAGGWRRALSGTVGMETEAAEGEEAGGLVEAEAGAELTGGGAEDAAAEGGVEGAEALELDGDEADSPGAVLTARPPPRTGLPGSRSWGRRRVSSVCQRDSSSRASSARLARVWSRDGFSARRSGQDGVADAVAGEGVVGVGGVFAPGLVEVRGGRTRSRRGGSGGGGGGFGRAFGRWTVTMGWMPLRPSVQAPRRSFMRTVSAWSSRVWAVRTESAWPEAMREVKKS